MEEQHKTDGITEIAGESPEMRGERRNVIFSVIISGFLLLCIWTIWFFERWFHLNLHFLALEPRTISGLPGIFFEPLLHGNFNHIASNSIPLFLLLTGALYFYRGAGLKALVWIWFLTGTLVWLFGRPNLHIGASGIVYGLASFHAFSGFIRNDLRLMSISLLTIFLYGSMIWGIFPLFPGVSWETHLMGGLSGLYTAIRFRKEGPQPRKYFDDEPPDEPGEPETPSEEPPLQSHANISIHYVYREKPNSESN